MQQLVIGGHTLEHHDADRFVDQRAAAGRFAGMGADTAADSRDRHVATDRAEGLVVAIILDLFDIGRDINMRRTTIHTGRGQLVVIAFCLLGLALSAQEGQVVVTEIFDRVENRFGRSHAERALAVFQQVAQPGQGVQVVLVTVSGKNACQSVHHDPCPAFAGGAFGATVLLLDALHILGGHGDDVDIFVQDNDAVPAHEGGDVALFKIVARQLERRCFRLTTLPIVDHLAAPAGKNHFSQVEPPVLVSFSTHRATAKKRLSAFLSRYVY